LQYAKAGSAATLPKQEKNNSEDMQQSRVKLPALCEQWKVNPRGDLPSASSIRWL
jgi:hypothetical protein